MSDRVCVVFDANDGPCVRSLFGAVAANGWRVVLVRVITPAHLLRRWKRFLRSQKKDSNPRHITVVVPGFRKFRRASEFVVSRARRAIERKMGKPDIIFFTMPRYQKLMRDEAAPKAYFAFDPYKLYHDWDYDQTEKEEESMLRSADLTFAVSRRISADWSDKVKRPTVYLPNAVKGEFMEACRAQSGRKPEDMAALEGPIVGCIGNINRTYDWVLIEKLSEALPNVYFVFVGQITETTPEVEELRRKKNVIFTGWRRPDELAECLAAFDVCLNPLTVNDMNNRRCPLRFYSYLCTTTPVVSTAIDEAKELSDYVSVGGSHDECIDLVKKAAAGEIEIDVERRREFMREQTWRQRAGELIQAVDKVVFDD